MFCYITACSTIYDKTKFIEFLNLAFKYFHDSDIQKFS